jgi:hypothetical protein
MTELDFDELDKAVNSLMAENDTTEKLPQTPDASNVSQPSSDAPIPPVTPSPALKRGRFMDIVAPSSNVRTAPVAVKREAASVTPPTIDEAVTDDVAPVELSESEPEELVAPIANDVVAQPASPEDVVEDVSVSAQVDTAPEDPTAPEAEPSVESTSSDEPLISPFLADAKVEKRPLGGDGTMTPEAELSETPVVEPVMNDESPVEVAGTAEEKPEPGDGGTIEPIPVPDELHEDVVAIESSEVMHEDVPSVDSEPTIAPEPSVVEPAPVDQQPPAGGSIMQQYDEQPSSGDQTNGAIYDTSTYHQPLEAATPKKKSSVLTWILWTLVLLILGATAGAAWFYFTTQ